jgi:hypothetical protein
MSMHLKLSAAGDVIHTADNVLEWKILVYINISTYFMELIFILCCIFGLITIISLFSEHW